MDGDACRIVWVQRLSLLDTVTGGTESSEILLLCIEKLDGLNRFIPEISSMLLRRIWHGLSIRLSSVCLNRFKINIDVLMAGSACAKKLNQEV